MNNESIHLDNFRSLYYIRYILNIRKLATWTADRLGEAFEIEGRGVGPVVKDELADLLVDGVGGDPGQDQAGAKVQSLAGQGTRSAYLGRHAIEPVKH